VLSSRALFLRNPETQKSAIVDFLFALLATRHFASCSVKPRHLSFTNPREAIFIILLAFSLLETSQVQGLSSQALIPRIPEMREVNRALTPFSRQRVSTCQPRGPHLVVLPHVLSDRLSALRYSRFGAPNLWALTLRTSEFARSLDLCHLSS
jgi:hypothetical protein